MRSTFRYTFSRSWVARFSIVFFILLSCWWLTIHARGLTGGSENNAFTLLYPLFSLWGGISGIFIAEKWGGFRSILGRSLLVLSLGLLSQFLGQAAYAYYIYIQGIEIPYPSLGDIGYFGSIVFYIYGVYLLGRAIGVKISLRSYLGQAQAILIPIVMLAISYIVFLRDYSFDWSSPLKILLDFGYPFGQAIYVSLAILAFTLSIKLLGGIMRSPILFLILALVVQYISDYTFLYQVSTEQWYIGGVNDYMYLISYFLMTLGLIQLGTALSRIRET